MSSNNINDKKTNSTKISRYLKLVSIALIIIGVLIFILRIILDSIYGGAHLKSVDNIFILIGLLLSVGAYTIEKNWKEVTFTSIFHHLHTTHILLNQTALFNECFFTFQIRISAHYRVFIINRPPTFITIICNVQANSIITKHKINIANITTSRFITLSNIANSIITVLFR